MGLAIHCAEDGVLFHRLYTSWKPGNKAANMHLSTKELITTQFSRKALTGSHYSVPNTSVSPESSLLALSLLSSFFSTARLISVYVCHETKGALVVTTSIGLVACPRSIICLDIHNTSSPTRSHRKATDIGPALESKISSQRPR